MNPDLTPLFDYLAEIVHKEYNDQLNDVQTTIPEEINTIIGMADALAIDPARKASLLENEFKYIFTAKLEFEEFNAKGDYADTEHMQILINRWQVDAERTRIYLELRERDWDAEPTYVDIDF